MGYSYHPPIFNFPQNNDRPLESLEHVSQTSRLGIIVGWHRCHGPKGANESTTSWNFLAMSAMSLNCAWIIFPYIFVWGSCFCLCTPVRSSCLLLPPAAAVSHNSLTRNLLTHTQLTNNFLTHTTLTHTTYSHTTYSHISLTHTTYRHTYTQT